jgi:hypothetical protein
MTKNAVLMSLQAMRYMGSIGGIKTRMRHLYERRKCNQNAGSMGKTKKEKGKTWGAL